MTLEQTQKKLNEYFAGKLETFGTTSKGGRGEWGSHLHGLLPKSHQSRESL